MRLERARAERNRAVRGAALEWRRAGEISETTFEEVERAYPDDSVRLAPIWRVSVFAGVFLALLAGAVGLAIARNLREPGIESFCLVLGIFCVAATEIQQRRFRFVSTGSDAATSFLAVAFLLVAWGMRLESGHSMAPGRTLSLLWLAAFVLFGLSAWRWGFPLYGFAGAVALIFFAGRNFPAARVGWFAAACLVLLATVPFLDRRFLPPSHRDALAAGLSAALAALYAVLNPWSVEARWIEEMSGQSPALPARGGAGLWIAAAATLFYTILLLFWGVRSRRRLVLDLGAAFAGLSLVTLRHYVHFAPLWLILSAAGAAVMAAASGLERWLRKAPEGERSGFTSRPLYGDEALLSNLSVAAAVATLSPGPAAGTPPNSKDFKGEGGGFGGAGADGSF